MPASKSSAAPSSADLSSAKQPSAEQSSAAPPSSSASASKKSAARKPSAKESAARKPAENPHGASPSSPYPDFDHARAVRRRTLELVADLDQKQSEKRPDPDTWSVGEVLDHLLRLDVILARELDFTIQQRRSNLPFIYRSIADIDTSIPWIVRPVLPFVEVPFGIFNAVFPQSLRRALTANRKLPAAAPKILRPEHGRPITKLRADLEKTYVGLERQQQDNADLDFRRIYYYNTLTGFDSTARIYRFISNHEERHQEQLRDILKAVGIPTASEDAA